MKSIKTGLFTIVIYLIFSQLSYSQFSIWGDEIYLRLEDENAKVIKGATISINGKTMIYSDSCPNIGYHTCYKCPKEGINGRVHLSIQHPDYLPFDDTVITAATVRLFKKEDTSYYYEYVKVPYKKKADHYITVFFNCKDSPEAVKKRIEIAGGTIMRQFSVCNFFEEPTGPNAIEYYLPRTATTESLLEYLGRNFDTGPLVNRYYYKDAVGIANRFMIYIKNAGYMPQAMEYLERLKKDSCITAYTTAGYETYISLEKGNEHKALDLIEGLLKTGFFRDPFMEFYVYECPF